PVFLKEVVRVGRTKAAAWRTNHVYTLGHQCRGQATQRGKYHQNAEVTFHDDNLLKWFFGQPGRAAPAFAPFQHTTKTRRKTLRLGARASCPPLQGHPPRALSPLVGPSIIVALRAECGTSR